MPYLAQAGDQCGTGGCSMSHFSYRVDNKDYNQEKLIEAGHASAQM